MTYTYDIKNKIEEFYQLPLADVFRVHHWEQKKTMLQISKECGLKRQSIMNCCKVNGVRVRNHKEHREQVWKIPRGKYHWAFGKNKTNSKAYRQHSELMKKNNPICNPETGKKRAITIAQTFRKTPWPQEIEFKKKLKMFGIKFIEQHPIEIYNIDFFIPSQNICIEIDSTGKWGKKRRALSKKRDRVLTKLGYKTLRINKRHLEEADTILKKIALNHKSSPTR